MGKLLALAGSAIDGIKINAISSETRGGRVVWVKRRRRFSGQISCCANLFFRLAENPVIVWSERALWQRWEIACFKLLNGETFLAFAEGAHTVCAEPIPGKSLSQHLEEQTLDERMLASAAREFRRAHQLQCDQFPGGAWSHGDPHLANLLYEAAEDRVRFIDFEVVHCRSISPVARHADDLLVVLLDLMGRLPAEQWLPFALTFLCAYNDPTVTTAVKERLHVPRGIPRLWWAIRTEFLNGVEMRRRVESLRAALP
ncbi:MAG: hypothetical protein M3O82_02985 [Verrucomicrobiota bacterium]|nr:hypothetical protein [Verrucomicrobiota bacterium]